MRARPGLNQIRFWPIALVCCVVSAGGATAFLAQSERPRLVEHPFFSQDHTIDRRFSGRWEGSGISLMLAPRSRLDGDRRSWFGAIPTGVFEGALDFPPSGGIASWPAVTRGRFAAAADPLRSEPAEMTLADNQTLNISIGGGAPLRLSRRGTLNEPLLTRTHVIGHRGLSLGLDRLKNTLAGVERASFFGCSGIEIDVTVPYRRVGAQRLAVADELRVVHPPEWRAELTGDDTLPAGEIDGYPTVTAMLDTARRGGIQFVYLDVKLRWLRQDRTALRVVLERVAAIASAALATHQQMTVGIGAETAEAADVLRTLQAEGRWPARLTWIAEFTRGTNASRYLQLAAAAQPFRPGVLSFNLMRISGAGGGPIGLLLPDLSADWERRYASLDQPIIFWTAATDDQFEGILRAAQRFSPAATMREIGVITPVPHRLAYYVATRPLTE